MTDALKSFDFNQVGGGGGLYLKFENGKAVKLRILTTDPVVNLDKFGNTRFGFVVWNHTDNKAQILNAPSSITKTIGALHVDADFGADIQKIDIKVTPSGEKLERRYDIQALPNAADLTDEQMDEAKKIKLEETIEKNSPFAKRMSFYDKDEFEAKAKSLNLDDVGSEPVAEQPIDGEGLSPEEMDDIPF